jgi:hypothetical protein
MHKRIRIFLLSLLALGTVAFGGATLANAGGTGEKAGQESNAPENSSTDPDNVQYTPPGETKSMTSKRTAHRSPARQRSHTSHGRRASTAQAETTGESPETSGESGSETSGSDGPGGHADEPSNPGADHQFQGQE